jgi:leucyl/phenylalanyl-tRNA--protein transferase
MARSIHWYRPDPRAVLPLEDGGLRVPRSVQRTIRKADFVLTGDVAFERVIRSCAEPRPSRGGSWLDESLVRVYTLLHQQGHAHSIEAWHPTSGELVGGIYGVSIGSFFAAESMFSDVVAGGSGASSACLSALWHHLRSCGYTLLDVQIANEHTLRFGVQEIPCEEYSRQLKAAIERPGAWKPFTAAA